MQLAVRMNRKRAAIGFAVTLTGIAIIVAFVLAIAALSSRDTRQDIDLADFSHLRDDVPAFEGFKEATAAACLNLAGCTQGYVAQHAVFRKFATQDAAATFAAGSTARYRSNWVVVEFTDEALGPAARKEVEEILNSVATSD